MVSRFTILDEVWDGETDLRSNVIDVHLAAIRAKIDRPFGTADHHDRARRRLPGRPGPGDRGPGRAGSRLPLRVRLVAGFSATMLVVLTAAGAFVYWRVQYALDRGLDTELEPGRDAHRTAGQRATGRSRTPSAADATGAGWQVLDPDGRVLASRQARPGPVPGRPAGALAGAGDGPRHLRTSATFLPASRRTRSGSVSTPLAGSRRAVLVVGVRRDHRDEALRELLLQLALAGLGALLSPRSSATCSPAPRCARSSGTARRADEIAAGAAGLRLDVPPDRDDEVTRLGHTLNDDARRAGGARSSGSDGSSTTPATSSARR